MGNLCKMHRVLLGWCCRKGNLNVHLLRGKQERVVCRHEWLVWSSGHTGVRWRSRVPRIVPLCVFLQRYAAPWGRPGPHRCGFEAGVLGVGAVSQWEAVAQTFSRVLAVSAPACSLQAP